MVPSSSPAVHPNRWQTCRHCLTIAIAVTLGAAIVFVLILTRRLPSVEAIRALDDAARVTTLYDASDKPLFALFKEERIAVPLQEVSPHIIHAVVAVEDERFYHHTGIDVVRIGASVIADIRRGAKAQGGSTITQQLAKRMFLDDRKTWWRKGREIALAFRIERSFSKDKILELYLNKVYFGHGCYGVESAARGYFGKSAKDVNLEEAALLAGLIQAPSAYAPQSHPEKAAARRATVLSRMVEAGFLDQMTATRLGRTPIALHEPSAENQFARYFKSYVTRRLVQEFGEEAVFDGGLKVYTTLDPGLQVAAERAVADGLAAIEALPKYKHPKPLAGPRPKNQPAESTPYLQGALVAMAPSTGYISALVGGRDFDDSTFDRATQAKRQPGSAFKPFIYAAALESGFTPSTLVGDQDPDPDSAAAHTVSWLPNEAHASSTDVMTVRTALRTSSNRAAVRVLADVGIDRAVNYVKRFGFDAPPAVPSLALGTNGVSVLSMTAAYAAFANGGLVPKPVAIRRVDDRAGRTIFRDVLAAEPAISDTTAFLTAQMLADVVNSGTAWPARREGFMSPAAGKTGTTNDYHDAWFIGFTPHLTTGVWVGYDQPRTIIGRGYAAELAVPMWARFMKEATRNDKADWFTRPSGMTTARICRLSGKLATDSCHDDERSLAYYENFVAGTEPTETCPIHNPVLAKPFRALAALFGLKSAPNAAHAPAAPPPQQAAVIEAPPPPKAEAKPEAKKRGFWSKVFGVGKDEKDKKDDRTRE